MKRLSVLILCLILAVSAVVPAAAEGFLHSYYTVTPDALYCMGGAADGDVTVTLDGKQIPATVTTVAEADLPITYFCIADMSSSMSLNQRKQEKDALLALSAGMRPGDSMVLAKMAEKLIVGEPMTDRAARDAAINEEWKKSLYTNLYATITESLELLTNESNYPGIRVLVLMSDGLDDKRSTVQEEDARAALRASGISMYTIGLVDPVPDNFTKKNAISMCAMSEETASGKGIVPNVDGVTPAEAAETILKATLNDSVICLQAADLARSGETVTLAVRSGEQNGTLTVPAAELPEMPTEPPTTAPATVPPTEWVPTTIPAPPEPPQPAKQNDVFFYILIGSGVAAVLIVAAIVILLTRKDEEDEPAGSGLEFLEIPEDYNPADSEFKLSGLDMDFDVEEPAADLVLTGLQLDEPEAAPKQAPAPAQKPAPVQKSEPAPVQKPVPVKAPAPVQTTVAGVEVCFTAVATGETVLEVELGIQSFCSFGRSDRANRILNAYDSNLSGCHFELNWDGSAMFLRDCNSTNGTIINGEFQFPDTWERIASGSIIHAGSADYCITF